MMQVMVAGNVAGSVAGTPPYRVNLPYISAPTRSLHTARVRALVQPFSVGCLDTPRRHPERLCLPRTQPISALQTGFWVRPHIK